MTNIQKLIEIAHKTTLKELLRVKYVEEGKTYEAIALELGVSPSSIRLWINQMELHQKRQPWNKGLTKKEMEEILQMRESNE